MKLNVLLFGCLLITAKLNGQDKLPYAEKAAKLQKEIWGAPVPEFKATAIPEKFEKESAVVIARSYSAQRSSNSKLKFMLITAGVAIKTVKVNTFHERVKINDKSALEDFSTIAYQKKLDKTVNMLIVKFANTQNTFIGAKIIKPDGKEVVINTSEEVLTQNETKDQQGKLAISGLQVGDILDYYVCTVDVSEQADGDRYKDNDNIFSLVDEYPVLYYSIDFQFSKNVKVKYIYANGAPHFTESRNSDGDLLLSVQLRDLPKYKSQLWSSPMRQYPYIEIGSSYTLDPKTMGDNLISKQSSMFEGNKVVFQDSFVEYADFDKLVKKAKDFFGSTKAMKEAPLDTLMKVLYDQWKFTTFGEYTENQMSEVGDINYRRANNKWAAITLSIILTDMKVDHEVLLVASRNSNSLENSYTMNDFDAMIRVNGPRPIYMAFDDVVTHCNEIPAVFEGEKAVALRPKRKNATKYLFTSSETSLPTSTSDKNLIHEKLKISLLPTNMQKLKVERNVKQTGIMRHDHQKALIPIQDIDNKFMTLTKGEPLSKRLSSVKQTKKMSKDYEYLFNKQREELSKNFNAEIKSKFDQEPEQLSDFKIVNYALLNTNEAFEFNSTFVLNNLVKKAGNNYIIDAGKLTGGFLKLEDKDKTREADICMPAARTFSYTLSITVPEGFKAKGVEELNQNKANQTGSFSSSAKLVGNVVTIEVSRVYNNNFEKVENWVAFKDLMDFAADFNDRKILLEKNI